MLAKVGTSWYRRYRGMPQRWRWAIPLGAIAVLGFGAVVWMGFREPPAPEAPNTPDAYDFTGVDPLTLAGMSGAETPGEIAEALSYILPAYDIWFQGEMMEVLEFPIAKESERLIAEAKKEAATGIKLADPVGDIDLGGCIERLEPWQCVLLRYAGDAITRLNEEYAKESPNPTEIAANIIRFHSSLRGMFPLEYARSDASEAVRAMSSMRYAAMTLENYMPAAQSPVNELLLNPKTTPIDQIQDAME